MASSDGFPEIAVRDKGERGHGRRQVLVADGDREPGAGRARRGLDIAHGDGAADGRAVAARGHGPDVAAGGILDRGALAGRRLAIEDQADAPAMHAVAELAENEILAHEAALAPPSLGDGEAEVRL